MSLADHVTAVLNQEESARVAVTSDFGANNLQHVDVESRDEKVDLASHGRENSKVQNHFEKSPKISPAGFGIKLPEKVYSDEREE